ncbi:helix-turn-helix transcriptional regulator [Microbaculum marinum]|uniref:Helix-turn-helix transcriptional regulator n=1 Tax=Microbaculum marinum TaxID=1764581 RepID=A0AAW9RRA3_9HYPH
MPRVHDHMTTTDGMLADSIISIAESRSVAALGTACQRAIGWLSGSPTIGLYLLNSDQPRLIYSRHAPEGFLEDYARGLGKADPFVDSIMNGGGILDGISLYGRQYWRGSVSYDLLHSWGFSHNMCGPLRLDDAVAGVFYTATPEEDLPYSPLVKKQMELLCRACSLALESLVHSGRLEHETAGDPSGPFCLPALQNAHLRATHLPTSTLPPRSAQVANLVCKGQTNKTIAREMGISDQTVKEHVAKLCRRYGAQNRTELAAALMSGASLQ